MFISRRTSLAFASIGLVVANLSTSPAALAVGPAKTAMITLIGQMVRDATPARVVIEVFAEPPTSQTDHLHATKREHWTRIASNVTSTGRSFSFKITASALRPYASPDGIVNLQAFAVTKQNFSAYGFSANMDDQGQTVDIGTMRLWPAASKEGFPNIAAWLAHPSGAIPDIHCATPSL
ncbi:MAG TPA: hypothetical protein VFI65_09810 [Streptosporangiaceae bacterium]|nr:hypothetical protein [Streptosporangiaceae bacterium]